MTLDVTKLTSSALLSPPAGSVAVTKLTSCALIERIDPQPRDFNTTQEGDVLLCQTNDDGEINIEFGIAQMTQGFETALYVSLFGGNIEDDGRPENLLTFWGNLVEVGPVNKYISRTQNLIEGLPITSGNLRRVEDAAKLDLAWLLEENIASSIEVVASIPGLNKIKISVTIEAIGEEQTFEFTENWESYRV